MDHKKKLLVSFSGGRTSALMSAMLKQEYKDMYEMIFVFANTGKELKETLDFVQNCDTYFGLNVVWVEAVTHFEKGKGVSAKVVTYETASRNGEPFEAMIIKHGLPSTKSPHCTRELKKYAIRAYARQIGWKGYYTAIGIRADEADRISENFKKDKIIYPLIKKEITKYHVNKFWSEMPFTLNLKGYQGNCDLCWKKSFHKLHTILKENPSVADWWKKIEEKYSFHIPDGKKHNTNLIPPLKMYRGGTTVEKLIEDSKMDFILAEDDSQYLDEFGCQESCEPF